MIFKKAYRKERTRDVAVVTDLGEYPIWEKDFEKLFSNLVTGDVINNPDELVTLAVRRQIKKSAVKKISAGNITRNALVRKITREKMFDLYPERAEVERVVDKLERAGFIDDRAYARRFIEIATGKLWGEYKIRASMRERGFKGEDIDSALVAASPDWYALASQFRDEHSDEPRESLFRKLQARGFSTTIISDVLDGE